ncbi:hypothetical protein [Mesorhizobium sp. L-2-11]|uniref:hypothetical protein n=1 Tax=Mesorhizobium sp. L-2-11 TaxID=2744521 RepID=UPI0019384271|nr:hypothetical protein [Mesorhizobium sp. L-2-11]BCH13231.1 hypothetical protein MesoLjLa_00820 [Mesorhizobium sp. L-2-11]
MRWNLVVLASCLAIAGCVGTSIAERQDANVQSSLQYDSVPCDRLLAQRNRLAQQYRLPQDAKPSFSGPGVGLGPFTPDTRSKAQRRGRTGKRPDRRHEPVDRPPRMWQAG